MKKFIKKTIAGLIAGVMAISSMPFTALANDYSEFDTMKSQMASFTAYQPSAHGSFSGDADYTNYEDHYKGLVYAEDVKDYSATGSVGLDSSWTGSTTSYTNLYFPTSVALYTGSNDVIIPIMISTSTAASGTWTSNYRPHAGVISGDGLSLANEIWNGYDEKSNTWSKVSQPFANGKQTKYLPPLNFMWTINQENYTFNTTASQAKNENIYAKNGEKVQIFANKVKVTPSFDSDTTVTSKSYTPSIRFYVSAGDKGFDSNKYIDLTSSDAVTVVNYQPYLNKLATVKSDVASMDATKYTVDSVKAYVVACNEFLNIDPSDSSKYSYSTDTKAVDSLVEAMNKAMTDYDSALNNLKELSKIDNSNKEAYEAALKEANAKVSEADNYTADSIDDLQKVIDDVTVQRENVKTNEDLDALTARLLTAVNNLNKKQLTVKLQVLPYGSETPEEKESKQINYGETYTSLESAIGENQNVKKWVVETNNGQTFTTLNTFDKVVNVVITEDTTIKAYLSDDVVASTSTKVTFLGRHNKVVAIKYVTGDEPFKTNTVDVPELPFYTSTGWDIKTVVCDGNEHVVRATYTANENENKCTVHFINGDTKQYTYNSYVYLSDAVKGKKYALYADADYKELLVVLDGVDFYTPQREHIYVKEYTGDAEANVAVMGSFATKIDGVNTAVYNCKFSLPEGATAVSWGVAIKFDNGSVQKFSIKEKSKRNEYTVNVKAPGFDKITAAAYVTYTQNGTETTKMSKEFVTVDLPTL